MQRNQLVPPTAAGLRRWAIILFPEEQRLGEQNRSLQRLRHDGLLTSSCFPNLSRADTWSSARRILEVPVVRVPDRMKSCSTRGCGSRSTTLSHIRSAHSLVALDGHCIACLEEVKQLAAATAQLVHMTPNCLLICIGPSQGATVGCAETSRMDESRHWRSVRNTTFATPSSECCFFFWKLARPQMFLCSC